MRCPAACHFQCLETRAPSRLMQSLRRAWVLALALLAASGALAQPITILSEESPMTDLRGDSFAWIDSTGQSRLDDILARGSRDLFTAASPNAIYNLGPQGALWLHLRLARVATSQPDWMLDFPLPLLDQVTVYQPNPAGGWTSQTAGDRIEVAKWPEPGRYAQFPLTLPANGTQDVYVRIQHPSEVSIPVVIRSRTSQSQQLQIEYLYIGLVLGALLLLIVACAVQSRVYRDRAYAWYAGYASVMALVVAAWTGVAGHLLWSHFAVWNDLSQGCLGMLGGGSALLMLHQLCGPDPRFRLLERIILWVGTAGLPLAVVYALLERNQAVRLLGAYLICVVGIGMWRAWLAWRRRDVVGFWVLAAFTPLSLATLLIIASIVGLVPATALSQYGLIVGLTIEVPLLLVALNLRSRERHTVEARDHAMASHDALTGLLSPHLFHDRFRQVLSRARRHGEPAAVLYIELVNHGYIRKQWGTAVAEQSLLRSVIKLRRILPDFNTVGRIDEARFGIILEAESSRTPPTELAARLIAAGLMPLKGLKPEVILQFHAAGAMLLEHEGNHEDIDQSLAALLYNMGSRTRRPIRFLEPDTSAPGPLPQSEFEKTGGVPSRPGRTLRAVGHSNR